MRYLSFSRRKPTYMWLSTRYFKVTGVVCFRQNNPYLQYRQPEGSVRLFPSYPSKLFGAVWRTAWRTVRGEIDRSWTVKLWTVRLFSYPFWWI